MIYFRNILNLIFKEFSKYICVFIPNKSLRHKIRDFFDYTSPYRVKKYFALRYVPKLGEFSVDKVSEKSDYVFQCWWQGEENAPDVVKKSIASVRKFASGKKYVLITKDNWKDWVDIPDYILKKFEDGLMLPAHFVDVLRLCLLSEYGGYWIDATCLMTRKFPKWLDESDFFMFHSNGTFSYTLINNCFIYSNAHHYLIEAWKFLMLEFWRYENRVYNYFDSHFIFVAMIENDERAKAEFIKMPKMFQTETHTLLSLWYDEFDEKKFKEILANSFIHKLTYKVDKRKLRKNSNVKHSFCDAFIKSDFDYILKCSPR